MNKNIFRIIFNEVRGVFMVVAETVSIRGGSGSKSACSGTHRYWAKLRPLSFSLMAAFGTGIWLAPAQAQVIADPNAPRGQQPNVLSAGNGVPLVNIRTPSAGGVSRNTYSQFDVNAQGVILNNAHNNAKTELGGWVQGNPWLAAGTARVILNEVNSSNPSQLRGYVEVAGDRAQVVIANPAGVTCDGCGFVNATRATLTTGTAILGSGGLEGYRVQGGSVVIEGNGLDGTRSDYTEIIARSVQINAGIWAQGLTVATGNGQFDNSNAMVAPVTAGTSAPSFAIDVSHLGGMYAGKIALIGTEAGVGVRNAGHIGGSAGAVTVSANGRLENAQGATIYASAGINLNAADVIENNGSISSQGNMLASSQAKFLNRGVVAAADELSIRASQIDNAKHVIGSVNGSVNLNATAGEVQNTEGRIEAKQDVSIQGAGINNQSGAIIGGNLRLDSSKELNNEKGFLVAQGNLAMTADSLSNKTGLVGAKGLLSLEGNNVLNEDGLFVSEGRIAMAVSQKLDNQGGQIRSQGDVELDASNGEILNDGKNTSSLIRSGGAVTIKASSFSNTETKGSGQGLNDQGIDGQSLVFLVSSLNNSKGSIRADDSASLIVGQKFDNTGGLVSAGKSLLVQDNAVAFSPSAWANALQGKNTDGRLIAGEQLSLSLKGLEGAGQILSLGTLTARIAGDYSNTGTIQANGSLSVSVQGTLNNQSKIQGADSLQVEAEVFDNTSGGEVMSGRETAVIAGNAVTNRGLIDGATTYVNAKLIDNLGTGRIYGNDVALAAETLRNDSESGKSASIMARNRLDIGVSKLVNAELSNIYSAGNIAIGGSLTEERKAVGRAQAVDNISATIESLGDMAIATNSLSNRNTHFSTKDVVLSTESFVQYQGAGSSNIYSSGAYYEHVRDSFYRLRTPDGGWDNSYRYQYTRTTSETQVATSIPGQILAGGNLIIEADSILNDKSRIIAGGNLQVAALDLVNTELTGSRTVRDYGTFFALLGHQPSGGGNDWTEVRASTYSPAPTVTEIRLSPTDYGGNKANVGTGAQIGSLAVNSVTQSAQNGGSKVVSLANSGNFSSTINSGSLFRPSTTPGATYVMESDPQFANYRAWLSSDYMLQQLSIDPATTQKRLGDGFYEQKLIREQVAQLTGRRFLDGYADDEAQYRSLLEQGAVFAKAHQLVPGVALTDAQMAQLTSDIVWLVEKTVTLPDGSKVQALVPQVYVRLQPGDLDGSGALLAGRNVDINLSQNLANSGTIAGRNVVSLQGQNLANLGGSIIGRDVSLKAVADINNLGGVIAAQDRLALDAGRNLTVASTTHSESTGNSSRTNIDRVAGLYVSNPKGLLLASAKNDITLAAADIRNDGVGGTTVIEAGGNLNLGTVQETYNRSAVFDSRNTYKESKSAEVGTSIQVQGDIALLAGSNFNARAAQVLSDAGTIGVQAQGSINISEGRATASMASDTYTKSKGSWGSKKEVTTRDRSDSDRAISSSFSGERVAMVAGKDLVVQGSNITSTQGTTLAAGNDLTIKAATETTTESHFRDEKNKGLFVGGGSITLGKKQHTVDSQGDGSSALGSLIGATDGDVTLAAGNAYRQIGSDIITPKGNIDISAKRVDIEEARETSRHTQTETFKQSGLTIGVSGGAFASAKETAAREFKTARESGGIRRVTNLVMALDDATSAKNAVTGVMKGYDKEGLLGAAKKTGVQVTVSLGSSKSESKMQSTSDTARGSQVVAGGDVSIRATGENEKLLIQGSSIQAGGNATLESSGDIELRAAANSSSQSSTNKSSSASIGASYGFAGLTVNASASKGKGNSNGNETNWTETVVKAGDQLNLKSGGNTTLQGAIAEAKTIVASVAGDLRVESLQDSSSYHSQQSNTGFSISVPVSGTAIDPKLVSGSGLTNGSLNANKQTTDGDYRSVVEQSGFKAGEGGFRIDVEGNTDLKGGVIASAADADKNRLSTGSLSSSDIQNSSSASSTSKGMNLNQDLLSGYGAVRTLLTSHHLGTDENANASGTTSSAVAPATIQINTQDGATKAASDQAVAALSRDTEGANQSVARIDAEAMEKRVAKDAAQRAQDVQLVTRLTDDAYRVMFREPPKFYKVECTSEKQCQTKEVDPQEVKAALAAGTLGSRPVLAVNGIQNDLERAAELAYQNAITQTNNESGERVTTKPEAIYLMHYLPASTTVGELLVAGYEKNLASTLGYTNADRAYADAVGGAEKGFFTSLGHSRGTLVQTNANDILSGRGYSNGNIEYRGVGGALSKDDYTKSAAAVVGNSTNTENIKFSYFANDLVSVLVGGNPGTLSVPEILRLMTTDNSAHSCYGTGAVGCQQVEFPGANPGSLEKNKLLIEYVGGVLKK